MKTNKVLAVLVMCLLSMMFLVSSSFAAPEDDDDLYSEHTAISKMLRKGGRGFTNIFTGWIEIPKKISRTWREQNEPVSGFFVGTATGFGLAVARTGAGFWDVFTFPVPYPTDYRPVFEPEFITTTMWDEDLPFMDNDLE